MKGQLFLVLFVAVLLITDATAQKKKKKIREKKKETVMIPETDGTQGADVFQILERDEKAELEAKLQALENKEPQEENEVENYREEEVQPDPCSGKRCGPGRECISNTDGKARCECMKLCPTEEDQRRRVCSNANETWTSDCELYRSRCMCDDDKQECTNPNNKHLHIDYYGECRQLPACSEEEMGDFPRRMREWLFNVMREMADRRELSSHYLQLEREAEQTTNEGHRTGVAAVWKWCDLDGHPHDRVVSRHELFPIRAPLMSLEHCIAPFLDNCDSDNDHRITLKEWGLCLEVPPEEMEDKCDTVRAMQQADDQDDDV